MRGKLALLFATMMAGLAAYVSAWAEQAAIVAPAPASEVMQKRPNVLVWMMDDVGFGQVDAFGGLVETPNIDRVAKMGLRYSNYHTVPVCSPARASFLTGRMSHSVHMGSHALVSFPYPGYDARVPASAGTIAENLRQAGYATFAVGKWDHLPAAEASPAGPFNYWPSGQGFEHYYGFLTADTDNFYPTLVRDNAPILTPRSPNYHLSADMADQAIRMIEMRDASRNRRPFFMYWASGAAHAPHHAPQVWLDHYRGKFDQGWDAVRSEILRRQIAAGFVPKGAKLAPAPLGLPAWNKLSTSEKRLYARQMEAFAASLSHADEQFGRILDTLNARGELGDTIVLIVSDNGASAEGGPYGKFNEIADEDPSLPSRVNQIIDKWGGPETFPHYSAGWAVAGDTPYRYWKQTVHEGGTRVPLIISWPHGIADHNALRNQFVHVSDIMPTILDAAGVAPAKIVNDVPQSPIEGQSIKASFAASGDPRGGRAQYVEIHGNKGLWEGGWSLVTSHRVKAWEHGHDAGKPFDDPWELYDLVKDPGQVHDVAAQYPDRVRSMAALWAEQAKRYNVLPQHNMGDKDGEAARVFFGGGQQQVVWSYAGALSNIPSGLAPPLTKPPFRVSAKLDMPRGDVTGPIFAIGGALGGMALYLDDGRPVFLVNSLEGETSRVAATEKLPIGANEIALRVTKGALGTDGLTEYEVELGTGGKRLARQGLRLKLPHFYGIQTTFDIGVDQGSTVMPDYPSGVAIDARIEGVSFELER